MPEKTVTIQLSQPEQFSFVPKEWPFYRTRVKRWFTISEAQNLSEKLKKETLLCVMGPKAHKVVSNFKDKVNDSTTLDQLLDLFTEYYHSKTNTVLERGVFWDRNQRLGESNSEYVTEMRKLVRSCEYADQKDINLRDKLLHGIRDRKLATELRRRKDLTLAMVVEAL